MDTAPGVKRIIITSSFAAEVHSLRQGIWRVSPTSLTQKPIERFRDCSYGTSRQQDFSRKMPSFMNEETPISPLLPPSLHMSDNAPRRALVDTQDIQQGYDLMLSHEIPDPNDVSPFIDVRENAFMHVEVLQTRMLLANVVASPLRVCVTMQQPCAF